MPAGSGLFHDVIHGGLLGETAQTLDPWNERLAFGERLSAAASCQVKGLSILNQAVEKTVNQSCLTEAHVTTDGHHAAMALFRQFICAAKCIAFGIAADDLTWSGVRRLAYVSRWSL